MITMRISCKELIFMKDGFIKVAACTLAYLNASEQYRVLYLALYDTAVSNKRI